MDWSWDWDKERRSSSYKIMVGIFLGKRPIVRQERKGDVKVKLSLCFSFN